MLRTWVPVAKVSSARPPGLKAMLRTNRSESPCAWCPCPTRIMTSFWPWAQAVLSSAQPVVRKGEINVEQITALNPDVIEALWSGLSAEEYALLSQNATVILPLPHMSTIPSPEM